LTNAFAPYIEQTTHRPTPTGAYLRSGRIHEALLAYQKAVRVQPRLWQAYNNLAVVYLMTGRPSDARESVKRAEKAGYHVSSELKKEIEAALGQPKP
jgi:tetratricopeptide (TPR) repeat protein